MIEPIAAVEFSADVVMYCLKPDQANYYYSMYIPFFNFLSLSILSVCVCSLM